MSSAETDTALPLISYPAELPVSAKREEIAEAIRSHQVVIVAGETGSGKTTQLPKICLELGRTSIAHTQPRRLAARTIAERIADELGVEVGGLVGYQVRFTDHASEATRIKLMTDGILLNRMHRDRLLADYDTIIIDEAHERSLNIDFLLGYIRRILPRRPDLKVIITSATIDPESFAAHFADAAGAPAPIVEVSGRTFPVEIRYRPLAPEDAADDVDEEADAAAGTPGPPQSSGTPGSSRAAGTRRRRAPTTERQPRDLTDGILDALDELAREKPGDVLVFLSGETEIRDAEEAVRGRLTSTGETTTEVLPLYGRLSAADQHRVFGRAAPGIRRRIVLATNVAETSLTVPGIRYVIDAGTARISRYSTRAKVQRLPIEPISQASATQRSGRSGRTSPGIAIRLYSETDFEKRPEFTEPEILRTNLASVILQMLALGLGDIAAFPFLTPPDARGVKDGLGLLAELGAITPATGKITPTGRQLARMPIEPRFARMVLESMRQGVEKEVRAIVAGLTIQDPRERPLERRAAADQAHARFADPSSDFLTLLNLWNHLREQQEELSSSAFRRMCKAEFLNYLRVREWQDVERQLRRLAKPLRDGGSHERQGQQKRHGKQQKQAAAGQRTGTTGITATMDGDGIHRALLAGLLSQIGLRDDRAAARSAAGHNTAKKDAARKPSRPSNEYIGSRQTRFTIHPASALAKKRPRAIMSAELVETSRLFARMNAAIDPAWAEPLAGEMVKRSYGEPHWEKKQGAAVAYETVRLFGVPIVERRRVQYTRIDPAASRELFLRHALVDGEFEAHGGKLYAFLRTNEKLRAELAQVEERTRRRDILYDDEAVYDFYDARIPADVATVRDFETWWRSALAREPQLLTMSAAELADTEEAADDAEGYPTTWQQGDQRFTLAYRFEPGAEDDGVSVHVPLPLLARLRPEGFDWQVPGLRHELVTALIKALPKVHRRTVVPAADWAAKILADLPAAPPEGQAITQAVAASIRRLAGTVIDPAEFDLTRLPAHLTVTFAVLDARGRILGRDKDLAALQERFAEEARRSVAAAAGRAGRAPAGGGTARSGTDPARPAASEDRAPSPEKVAAAAHSLVRERTGITAWDLDELPRVIDIEQPGPDGSRNTIRAYPALVVERAPKRAGKGAAKGTAKGSGTDAGSPSVALRLMTTPEDQRAAMPPAVRRLMTNAVPSPVSYVQQHLTPAEKLSLGASGYPSTAALFADCLAAVADETLFATHPDGLVFTRAEFEAVRDAFSARVMDRMFEAVALVARILTASRAAEKAIQAANNLAWLAALTDARGQLASLVYPGFISRTGLERLAHLPRYLAAIAHRMEVLPRDPGRDRVHQNEIEQATALYTDAGGTIPLPAHATGRLRHVRWMLEEFRVSLFAQQLGTAETVSLKRIRRALEE